MSPDNLGEVGKIAGQARVYDILADGSFEKRLHARMKREREEAAKGKDGEQNQ